MSKVLPEKLRNAFRRFQARDLAGAERLCGEVLSEAPRHPDALHLLGVVRLAGGNAGEAVTLINQALEGRSRDAAMLENLGVAHLALRNFTAAEALFREAFALGAANGSLCMRLGIALSSQGKLAEAVTALREAAARAPGDPDVHLNLGNVLAERGEAEEALACYRRVLALQPDHPAAHFNLGNLHRNAGRLEEAEASYRRVLAVAPNDADVHNNLGLVYERQGRPDEAAACYRQSLALRPDHVHALSNLGDMLGAQGRLGEAAASCERALEVQPDFLDALVTLGNVRAEQARPEEAQALYKRALRIDPDCDYARGSLLRVQMQCCEWAEYDENVAQISEGVRAGRRADVPFNFLAVSGSAADQLSCSRIFVADKYPAASQPLWRGERYRHERIRLAYLSADFRVHPSSSLLAGLFEHHDRSRFETMAISFGDDDGSGIRARLKAAFERFFDVRDRSDLAVARLMRELEVDIAVDLTGHTQYARTGILAFRPAPVQVNFFCPGTSGADYLDYIVCDRIVIPEDHHVHYSEKVVYLPDTFQANDSRRSIAERTPTRAEAGLPDDGFVFCSFNQPYKFTPAMFDVWMRLLHRVEGSVLWLQQINAASAGNLRGEAIRRGIDANRLVFAPRVPRMEDHLARYRLADLFLDTLPYNAQTTASDALWAGLPLITCLGTTFSGRVAASLLNAVGLPELIARSLPEYEALALDLATQPARLAHLRSKLARNRATCPLFDTARFCRHIESAFVAMWERHQRGEPPASFAVPGLSWQP
jgi:predicted O-linked N-acetylglucosamine transferase (SPINDLY family)